MNNAFFAFLAKEDVEYKRNVSLKELSSVKIGGKADCVIYPDTIEKLVLTIENLVFNNYKWKIVGRMTNLLVTCDFYDGALISTARLNRVNSLSTCLCAECGISYSSFFLKARSIGYLPDAELYGIPGSIGGMIYSNAGAYGREISDSIINVSVFSPYKNKVISYDKSMLDFGYRESRFKNTGEIILNATFSYKKLNGMDILPTIAKIKEKRRQSQPIEYPSLGSIFKKYNGISAGYYIDNAGLKGFSVGGAMVSEKHAGFIINIGDATAEDYTSVIKTVKEAVYNKFKIMLEEEIEYI